MNFEVRKSILYHEHGHHLTALSGEYPGAYKIKEGIRTGIYYYKPYSEEEIAIYQKYHISYDPRGELIELKYVGSNTYREHRDVYQRQIDGHYEGLYNLSPEMLKYLESTVKEFEDAYQRQLQYEEDHNLNADGTPKE